MEKVVLQAYPAADWREATPVGNGRLGALVHGRASDERLTLNHEALFNWSARSAPPDLSSSLPEVRRLLDEGRFAEADRLYPELLGRATTKGRSGKFFPAFDLRMRFRTCGPFRDYARELDMAHGLCAVRWRDAGGKWERIVFADCSRKAAGAIAVRIRREGAPFSMTVSLPRHDLIDYPGFGGWDTFSSLAVDEAIYSSFKTDDGLDFRGMVRIVSTDGTVSAASGGEAAPSDLCVEGASFADIVVDVQNAPLPIADFTAMLAPYDGASFNAIQEAHSSAFAARFDACTVSLAPAGAPQECNERLLFDSYKGDVDPRLVEKMSDFGRYLLLSSSGFGCALPANLQGLWNGDYTPAWCCAYFLNINIQMAYWQALRGGMAETLMPLFDLCDRMVDDFRVNAQRLYGCRGILLPVFMDAYSGFKHNPQPHCVYWTCSAAWVAALYFEYWKHTGDIAFLRDRAWPFMREAALFHEDFLADRGDGLLHAYPSVSPENHPLGAFEGAGEVSVSVAPTMDVALVRELLANCLAAADALAYQGPEMERWRGIIRRLPPYTTNATRASREWLDDRLLDNDHHRHLSHLYPLFPGREISRRRTPELFEAARRAAEARLATGLADQTGWSLAHLACVWARLGEGDRALGCLELILRCCTGPNLLTRHNDWRGMGVTLEMRHGASPPIQLDAAFGFAAAVQEMLLGEDGDALEVLPALPSKWGRGAVHGLCERGGIVVDIEWSPTSTHAAFRLLNGFPACEIDVFMPGRDEPVKVALQPGARIDVEERGDGR